MNPAGYDDQFASAVESIVSTGNSAGSRAIDLRVHGGIDLRLLPDRGLDIGAAWFAGTPLGWIGPNGEQGSVSTDELTDRGWREVWGGGLVTTCGLSNVGAASDGHGLHGTYTARPAADVVVERSGSALSVTATIVDPPFSVSRRIVTAIGRGQVHVEDRVVNDSEWTAAAPMLYHVNVGAPLWSSDAYLESDAEEIVPRDAASAARLSSWDEPPAISANAAEAVFEHVGASSVRLIHPSLRLGLAVHSTFPRLWQWVDPSTGINALAIEPANCSVLGRAADIASGQMPFLDPGEARVSSVTIEALST